MTSQSSFGTIRALSPAGRRPKIAALTPLYAKYSHAEHSVDRFLEGYGWQGQHHRPAMDVVSLYTEQRNVHRSGLLSKANRVSGHRRGHSKSSLDYGYIGGAPKMERKLGHRRPHGYLPTAVFFLLIPGGGLGHDRGV